MLPTPNAKMTTFQSLFKRVNLKALMNTLKHTHQQAPLPFYVLRIDNSTPAFPEYSSLSISYLQYHVDDSYPMKL